MTEHVTYSLTCNKPHSEAYYLRVRRFTDELLRQASSTVEPTG